jgi:hypothetical protein
MGWLTTRSLRRIQVLVVWVVEVELPDLEPVEAELPVKGS